MRWRGGQAVWGRYYLCTFSCGRWNIRYKVALVQRLPKFGIRNASRGHTTVEVRPNLAWSCLLGSGEGRVLLFPRTALRHVSWWSRSPGRRMIVCNFFPSHWRRWCQNEADSDWHARIWGPDQQWELVSFTRSRPCVPERAAVKMVYGVTLIYLAWKGSGKLLHSGDQ